MDGRALQYRAEHSDLGHPHTAERRGSQTADEQRPLPLAFRRLLKARSLGWGTQDLDSRHCLARVVCTHGVAQALRCIAFAGEFSGPSALQCPLAFREFPPALSNYSGRQ